MVSYGRFNILYQAYHQQVWVHTVVCKLQKGCTRLAATSDKVYQLLAHGRWFSSGIPASSTTKTGHHDIAEILLKMSLNNQYAVSLFYDSQTGEVGEPQTGEVGESQTGEIGEPQTGEAQSGESGESQSGEVGE